MYTTGSTKRNSSPIYYVISTNAEYTYMPICVKSYLLYLKRKINNRRSDALIFT